MSLPRIATREEWLAAREELLAKEKKMSDEVVSQLNGAIAAFQPLFKG